MKKILQPFKQQVICILCGILGVPGIMITHVTPQRSDDFLNAKSVVTLLSLLCLVACIWLAARITRQTRGLGGKIRYLALTLVAVAAGAYLILLSFVVLFQKPFIEANRVIFQPKAISTAVMQAPMQENVEALEFVTPDSEHLHGWLVKNGPGPKSPLVIYFGGSSQEVSNMIPYFHELDGWSVALVNYRGYGTSEGSPSEANFFQDALLIYDTLAKREDIEPQRIVPMGWSLGTGVAVYLSEQRPTSGTILATPFDSWAHMFQSRDFPLVPLAFIRSEYFIFNSIGRASSIDTPLLCLTGSEDTIVLPSLSQELAGRWRGEETFISYAGSNHGLLFQENSSWEDIARFLDGL